MVDILTKEDFNDYSMDDLKSQTLEEIGNIMINGIMGSIGNMLKTTFDMSLPTYIEGELPLVLNSETIDDNSTIIYIKTLFNVKKLQISGLIIMIFRLDTFVKISSVLDGLYD